MIAREVNGYVLIVVGVLWTFLGGACEVFAVADALGPRPGSPGLDWTQVALGAIWLVPGMAIWIIGVRLLRRSR